MLVIFIACFKDDTMTYSIEHPTIEIYSALASEHNVEIPIITGDTLELEVDSIFEINSIGAKNTC